MNAQPKFTDALAEFRTTCDPVADALIANLDAIFGAIAMPRFPRLAQPVEPCGSHCADRDGALCGYHDAWLEGFDEEARVIAAKLTEQPAMLFEWSLIDVGEVGQPVSRILAAIFRGESPSVADVEAARQAMTDVLMDEGRRLLRMDDAEAA